MKLDIQKFMPRTNLIVSIVDLYETLTGPNYRLCLHFVKMDWNKVYTFVVYEQTFDISCTTHILTLSGNNGFVNVTGEKLWLEPRAFRWLCEHSTTELPSHPVISPTILLSETYPGYINIAFAYKDLPARTLQFGGNFTQKTTPITVFLVLVYLTGVLL